jgi:hypothetical protein
MRIIDFEPSALIELQISTAAMKPMPRVATKAYLPGKLP